jgi:hypothetical protein
LAHAHAGFIHHVLYADRFAMMNLDPGLQLQDLVVVVILRRNEQEIGALRFEVAVDRERLRRRNREVVAGQPAARWYEPPA